MVNQNRTAPKDIINEHNATGYTGLTEEFLNRLKAYVLKRSKNSFATGEDIRNLNPTAFRDQFKTVGREEERVFTKIRKLLSRLKRPTKAIRALWD